jgi:hypothetical protein
VSAIIKVHISTCPECGTNEWLMEVPDDVAKETHAKRVEDTPGDAYRRGVLLGWLVTGGGVLSRLLIWRYLWRAEKPPPAPSETTIVCANCGHEMNLAQTGASPRPVQNWPLT